MCWLSDELTKTINIENVYQLGRINCNCFRQQNVVDITD